MTREPYRGEFPTHLHEHAALNTLLQNAGAVAVKLATVKFRDNMIKAGINLIHACISMMNGKFTWTIMNQKEQKR